MIIHTIGCSFTNYIYPTWADYIDKHYDATVNNLGYPAQGNDTIKKHLYTIDRSDHVVIMFSGYDRISVGVDKEHLYHNNNDHLTTEKIKSRKQNFFRNDLPFSAFVPVTSTIRDKIFSKFHMIYNTLEIMYDCQNYLENKNIDYTFCLWQGLYNNIRVLRSLNIPKIDISAFMSNKIYKKVFESLKTNKFAQPLDEGLWENIFKDKELVLSQSTVDIHPSSLCHFVFFKKYLKPILDKKFKSINNLQTLEDKSKKFSKWYADLNAGQISKIYPIHEYPDPVMEVLHKAKDYFFKVWNDA